MLNAVDVKKVQAKNNRVVVALKKIPNSNDGFIIDKGNDDIYDMNHVINFYGKVLSVGPDVKEVSVNDYIIFHQLAGAHIFSKEKELVKVISEINIVAKSKMSGMMVKDVRMIKDRLLINVVEQYKEEKTEEGIILSSKNKEKNLRQKDLYRGEIIKVSASAKKQGYKKGDIAYFQVDVGNDIKEVKGKGVYKTVYWQDVEFVLSE